MPTFEKNLQYARFCAYGFLKNLRFFDAFLLLFFLENGFSYSQIGVLYATREITTNLMEVPSGIIADSYGRKTSLLGAFLLYMLSFGVFYLSSNFLLMLLAMLLFGLGDAFRSGTHKGMIMDYLKIKGWQDQKIAYYGNTRSWSQRGSAISALLAGILVFFTGEYRLIYLISLVPYLLNFINLYTYPDELNFSLKPKKRKRQQAREVLQHFFSVLKKRQVLDLVNSSALHSAFLKSIKDYIQPLLVHIALMLPFLAMFEPKSQSGLAIGVVYFGIFLLTSFASRKAGFTSQLGIKNIEKKSLLLGFGLVCGLLFYFGMEIGALVFFVAIYALESLRKPILTGYLADEVPNEILTSVISAQSSYKTLMTAFLALSIGVLSDKLGVGAALAIVAGTLFLFTALTRIGRSRGDISTDLS